MWCNEYWLKMFETRIPTSTYNYHCMKLHFDTNKQTEFFFFNQSTILRYCFPAINTHKIMAVQYSQLQSNVGIQYALIPNINFVEIFPSKPRVINRNNSMVFFLKQYKHVFILFLYEHVLLLLSFLATSVQLFFIQSS